LRGTVTLPGLTPREALTQARFWRIGIAFFLVAVALAGTVGHVVPLLTDRGVTPEAAAAAFGAFGLSTMTGRFVGGFLVDRIFAPYVAAGFSSRRSPASCSWRRGAGRCRVWRRADGARHWHEIDLIAFLVSRYFGQRSFGQLYGWLFMMFLFGATVGRFLGGVVYDLAHSYTPFLIGSAIELVVAVALLSRLGPYAYPVEREPPVALSETPAK